MVSANAVKTFVDERFNRFGITKRQEVSRLLYEISKRENKTHQDVLVDLKVNELSFDQLKRLLVQRRYPSSIGLKRSPKLILPELDIQDCHRVTIKKQEIVLKNVYIEKEVLSTNLVGRLKQKYPKANFVEIDKYKHFIKGKEYGVKDYNRRLDSFFIVHEDYDFFKQCPCSKKSVFCNYHLINLGSGCAFECSYCFLQDYVNAPGIILPANLEDFFDEFKRYKQDIRIGSGELTDSLVFDHITEYSPQIVEFFKDYPKSQFEFKTKSNNIDLLLNVKPAGNIIVSWTMSPQNIVDSVEHLTASLDERIEAAKQCAEAGYLIALHFDPIIYHEGWEDNYRGMMEQIFTQIPKDKIMLISLGTLRMTPRLKKIIENRFPDNTILDEEFYASHDTKLRYSAEIRAQIYQQFKEWITSYGCEAKMYLCMEEKGMCEQTQSAPLRKYSNN